MKKLLQRVLFLGAAAILFCGCGAAKEKPNAGEIEQTQNETEQVQSEAGQVQGEIEQIQSENKDTGKMVTFTDALGRTVELEAPQKVAVLSGSYADCWLLSGGTLTAVSEDAEEILAASSEIVSVGSVKHPSVETMLAEEIDFVVLSSAIAGHVDIQTTLENAGVTVAYFEVETFDDYDNMMQIFTDITGRKDLYEENVTNVRAQIAETIKEAEIALETKEAPTVLFLRAFSNGVKAKGSDSMTGQMLKDLGCVNIADTKQSLLEDLSLEAIIAEDPDYIFVTTMGDSEEAAIAMVEEMLTSNPAWNGLSAVENGNYVILPQELFHNKPNERWGESYQMLAEYLYGAK